MKVQVVKYYFDREKDTYMDAGTVLDVPAERGKVLIEAEVAKEIKDKEDNKDTKKDKKE